MPIPDTPYTRKEAYLNAVATGDSSGIPETPYTREEMYLDAIARNGGGGGSGGGGSSTLSGLTDVDISNPSDGQTLVYDAASSKWVNGSGGGGVLVVNAPLIDGVATMDKTWQEIYDAVYAVMRTRNIGEGYDVWAYDQVSAVGESESKYFVETVGGYMFKADSTDDYPVEFGLS